MSGFTSVLKKIGQAFATAGAIGAEVAGLPFVGQILSQHTGAQAVVSRVFTGIDDLVSLLATVEVIGSATGATGPQKLEMAAPLIEKALIQWAQSSLPKHELKDPAKAAAAAKGVASNLADFLNAWG